MREPVDSPSVDTDDRAAARQMTVQLLEQGHRRIGFMLGPPGHRATEQRYLGFADAMHARAARPARARTDGQFRVLRRPGVCAAHSGLELAADGDFCQQRRHECGEEPPARRGRWDSSCRGGQSIAGFDDAPVASMIWPQLATVRQPVREIARIAADLIIRPPAASARLAATHPRPRLDLEPVTCGSIARGKRSASGPGPLPGPRDESCHRAGRANRRERFAPIN